ncbi:unnamed protein product [Rotaria sp. Silwood2]|nr:unnamed protein product [Rotaria sp. Silwood2]
MEKRRIFNWKKNENDTTHLLEGLATCNHCYMAYRTHSKTDANADKQGQKGERTTSLIQPKFAFHKNALPEKYKLKLKDAELKFIVAGSHSFKSLENDGTLKLVQTAIEIGADIGLVDVHDIFYGRQTIREETLSKFHQYTDQVCSLLEESIKQHCVTATTDLRTDDLMKRTYLDFTIFFVNDIYELNHTLLRCKHFQEEKSGINIWYQIEEIFKSFNLSFGDTLVTTDQAPNMVKALSLTDETSIKALCRSLATVN